MNITNDHAAVLTNLSADRQYFYAIEGGTNIIATGSEFRFRTPPSGPKPTRIWALGDFGTAALGSTAPIAVRDAYESFTGPRETDVWLMLGDNAYPSGTDE